MKPGENATRRLLPWEKGGASETRIKNHPIGDELDEPAGAIRRLLPWEKGAVSESQGIKNHPLTTEE
jgi:hypothetical protein